MMILHSLDSPKGVKDPKRRRGAGKTRPDYPFQLPASLVASSNPLLRREQGLVTRKMSAFDSAKDWVWDQITSPEKALRNRNMGFAVSMFVGSVALFYNGDAIFDM